MAPISEEMIRKRAEHNEGIVATLKEISLHQQDIEKIEVIGSLCRQLEILYLQNNLIGRIENVHKLKELKYLNLAVNNIKRVEGLEGCESLNKLDLTVNFVDKHGLLTLERLRMNTNLRDLYLTGNPCQDWEGYRDFVVATLPSLKKLDGVEIKPSERIAALQVLPELRAKLAAEVAAEGGDVDALCRPRPRRNRQSDETENRDEEEEEEEPKFNEKGERVRRYTPATRLAEHREMAEERAQAEKQKATNAAEATGGASKAKLRKGFDPLPEGERIYQKNEGKWDFRLRESEDGAAIILEVSLGRYLDTALIDVDVQPSCVRVLAKGKLLQLVLSQEVCVEKSSAQRSTTTGALVLTMPKVSPVLRSVPSGKSSLQPRSANTAPPSDSSDLSRGKSGAGGKTGLNGKGSLTGGAWGEGQGSVSIRGIVRSTSGGCETGNDTPQIQEAPKKQIPLKKLPAPPPEELSDDDEVPPLE